MGAAAGAPRRLALRLRWKAPLWPYLATLFDYGENVCFLLLVERRARADGPTARLGVVCKRLKLASLGLIAVMTNALLLTFLLSGRPARPPR